MNCSQQNLLRNFLQKHVISSLGMADFEINDNHLGGGGGGGGGKCIHRTAIWALNQNPAVPLNFRFRTAGTVLLKST